MDFFSQVFSFVENHWLSAIVFIAVFSVLIILHELGHFWAARKAGVGVLEFGFGLPPKLLGKKTSKKNSDGEQEEMEWTLNAIPFGGFVRLEGEEEKSDKPSAFGNRPLLWRILVVCGGVIMNFLLGWILFTIGYGIGINPLSPSSEQKMQYVKDGLWTEYPDSLIISSIPKVKEYDLKVFDMPQKLDGHFLSSSEDFNAFYNLAITQKKEKVDLVIKRFNSIDHTFDEKNISLNLPYDIKNSDFSTPSPLVEISNVDKNSPAYAIGLKKGDIIKKVEQSDIIEAFQFVKILKRYFEKGSKNIRVTIDRKISSQGDNTYLEKVFIIPFNQEGKIGVSIRNIFSETKKNKIILENRTIYIPNKKISYPWTEAPIYAFKESVRWMNLSLHMVKNVFTSILGKQKIPDGIGGPIAIADATDKLVENGDWTKILQFTAILSLSLAVVNIMPFPGLDGGRLLFLLFEGIVKILSSLLLFFGVKKNFSTQFPEKYERYIHSLGYFSLLIFIVLISWKDIQRLFF